MDFNIVRKAVFPVHLIPLNVICNVYVCSPIFFCARRRSLFDKADCWMLNGHHNPQGARMMEDNTAALDQVLSGRVLAEE